MEKKVRLAIKDLAEADRPREKMLAKGLAALSDAELLAILVGSGSVNETAVELMQRVLASCGNDLNALGKRSVSDLCAFKGIGTAKAVCVVAALELGRRRGLAEAQKRRQVLASRDAYAYFHPLLGDAPQEEFWLMCLNQSNRVIECIRISLGGITETAADVRTILREALLRRATGLIVCHNHPSGNPKPSAADDRITDKLAKAARLMDLRLCDHLIVCDDCYYSYADEGRLG